MQKLPSDQARHHVHGPVARQFAVALVAMVLGALTLPESAPSTARPIVRAESLSSAPRSADQRLPILGAGLTIFADGSAPWEDRPLLVPGLGTLPGKRGEADPGDYTGPADRVVRSWDTIFYRVAVSVRGAPADEVAVEVTLTGHLGTGTCGPPSHRAR